jgi:hypothetical protein
VVQCKLLALKKKVIYEIIQTESPSENKETNQPAILNSQNRKKNLKMVITLVMIALSGEKEGDRSFDIFAGKQKDW